MEQPSLTAYPSPPSNNDIGKWYADLREKLDKRVNELDKKCQDLEKSINGIKSEDQKILKDNLKADIKVKNLYWWLLLLIPFLILLAFITGFNLAGHNDRFVDFIKYFIYGIGLLGIIEMLYVGYKVYTLDDRVKKIEDNIERK